MNQVIQDLKALFTTASDVEKIALARQIIKERQNSLKEYQDFVDDIKQRVNRINSIGVMSPLNKRQSQRHEKLLKERAQTGDYFKRLGLHNGTFAQSMPNEEELKKAFATKKKNDLVEKLTNKLLHLKGNLYGIEQALKGDDSFIKIKTREGINFKNPQIANDLRKEIKQIEESLSSLGSVAMILDDATNNTMTILQLKNQFPTANGMGKIALAKQIIEARNNKYFTFDDATSPNTNKIADLKNQFPTANGMGKIALAKQILALRKSKSMSFSEMAKKLADKHGFKKPTLIHGQIVNPNEKVVYSLLHQINSKDYTTFQIRYNDYGVVLGIHTNWNNEPFSKKDITFTSFQEADSHITSTLKDYGVINAANPNDLLESNRIETRNENQRIQNPISNDRGTGSGSDGRTGRQVGTSGDGQQSDSGLPTPSSATSGTGSNTGMDKRNGEFGLTAGNSDNSGSTESSRFGILDDRATNSTIEADAGAIKELDRTEKARLQREAESFDSIPNDEESIRADLPFLLPEQQDDIIKIEKRFADANGMMITNGTGTGKTYTALGAIKRFAKQGKDSILIVCPGDKIMQDFVDSAKNLHLEFRKLENIQDNGGKGIAITSYANFYQNESLMRREWDLVVFDEAHKINSNQAGDDTGAQDMMRKVTNHKKFRWEKANALASSELGYSYSDLSDRDGEDNEKRKALDKLTSELEDKLNGKSKPFTNEQLKEFELKRENDKKTLKKLDSKIFSASHPVNDAKIELEKYEKKWQMLKGRNFDNNESYKQRYLEGLTPLQEKFNQALAKQNAIQSEYDNLKQLIAQEDADRERTKTESESNAKPVPQSKVLFLSATPFAYEKSLDYAEGYLFDYGNADGNTDGYNSGGGYERFMMQHFGYTMRYNKLTRPDANVNGGAMQRQFNQFLKEQGALSGRALKVDADYSREFIILHDKIGEQIDAGLDALNQDGFADLSSYIRKTSFNYLSKLKLLEAIKAKALVARIKKHLALNRKVVLFHSYKVGGAGNPFRLNKEHKEWRALDNEERNKVTGQYWQFENKYSQFTKLNFEDLESPIETFKKEFGSDLMIYNGDIPKKQILQHANDFNDDDKSKDIILMQVDKGKEGVSLHDTTGKKTRVLINLGLPTKPTDSIQIEGRIYRTGQMSNAIFEYISTGTQFEKRIFSEVIAERSSTAENLALGNEARDLLSAFTEGYLNATDSEPNEEQGTGGKQYSAAAEISPFEKAKSDYFATQKANKYTKAKGIDYFPTPEPIGLKMVELANIGAGESALEPSAGHGAIARYFPENAKNTFIEPSTALTGDLSLRVAGNGEVKQQSFEDLSTINKFNAIVMNPPFGSGGKTAIEHLSKATKHLRDGGRIVAIIPKGGNATKLFNLLMATAATNDIYLTAEIFLPPIAFERAGTSVASQIVVLDRIDDPEQVKQRESVRRYDYQLIEDINELFDTLESQISILPRPISLTKKNL